MCFAYDARPPIPAIAGAAVQHEDLTLEAADGARLSAFAALAEAPLGPAVVVMPDVRGLYRFYEELALRFAERGYDAIAIDYFGRTAGLGKRGEDFDFWPEVQATTAAGVAADVRAAADRLRAREGQAGRAVFTVGFCFGGSASWQQAAEGHGLAGAIGFYGGPTRKWFEDSAPVIERAGEFECPVLALQAGDDQNITKEHCDQFEAALREAGVEHLVLSYHGSPHSFFDRTYEEHRTASADAWERVLAFIGQHS